MPLPGGAADKIGNRYEGRWTVYCMLDVMAEKAEFIQLEKPGEDAFEFVVCQGNRTKCYQVKRQITGRGQWTLSVLKNKTHVLSDFWEALKNPNVDCFFASTQDADELNELANRAKDSTSWQEFKDKFLNQKLSANFQTLREKWDNCSEKEAYEGLKRVYVETVGEDFLVDTIENRIASLVEGDPKTIRCELAELALEKIHHQLTAWEIWHYLTKERKYRRREWHKDRHVLDAVDKVNNLYFNRFKNENIGGEIITRDEVSIVVDKLTSSSSEKRGVLLTGEAGVGKSGVIGQVVKKLGAKSWPMLAFRIDRLKPTQSLDSLGKQLEGLPGSPTNVLAAVSQGRKCVLIIDQVDAVSTASGRNPSFFECIDRIIKQAETFPNIRLLLACRKFDVDNDSRIRRLTDKEGIVETVSVNKLTHTKVKEICSKLGLDVARLNQKQQDLLSIPLHLSLLAEIIEDKTINVLNFKTAKDLLDKFCHSKRNKLRERLGYSIEEKWTQVIDALCEYMSGKQTLSAPKTTVRSFKDTVDFMVSEHILTKDNGRISFFHESFFDYAFADKFYGSETDLLSFLTSDEQHLFRRAQVRQILLHQRDNDFELYLDDLENLLTSSDIRLHIKQVVLALLINLEDPKQEEWEIIAPLLNDSYPLKDKVWQIFYSSVSWFKLLDDLNVIHDWLNSGDEELIECLSILLSIIQRQLPDRVAEIVEPYIGVSDAWQKRLIMLVHKADIAAGRGFFELFLRLIDEGLLDEVKYPIALKSDFWNLIYSLPKKHPDWSCEVIGHYLNRLLNISIVNNELNPFERRNGTIPNSQFAQRIFMDSAKNSPEAFVENVLPFMIRVMELTAYKENDVPWKDAVWEYRTYGSSSTDTDVILEAMETALSSLAVEQPEIFATFVKNQLDFSEFETIQYLLIRAYTANGKIFADEAINYLCQRPTRFNTGYLISTGNSHAAIFWPSKELLEATTPYCSDECLEELEKTLLNYYPAWEKNHKFLYSRGYGQCVLLSAIVPSRCSETITRKLEELERKFIPMGWVEAPGKIEPPESLEVYTIGSPIPEEGSEKMTDEQWLKAIVTYNNDLSDFKDGRVKGGAGGLSIVLEKQVKQKPLRFASLIKQFPNDTNVSYFNAVLRGIAETEESVDIEIVRSICQHCHQLPQHPCGKSMSYLFEKLAKLPWTISDFEILIYYALNDPDPSTELWKTQTNSSNFDNREDILGVGINSNRGRAVYSIAKLIFADKSRASHFSTVLEQIVKDPSTAVRSCAAIVLTAMLNYDRDMAVRLFLELCKTDEEFLGTKTVGKFLYYALQTHCQELKPVLEQMITSELPKVVRTGARQACLLSLVNEEVSDLANHCLSGTENHRLSAAEIFVANLRSAHFREFCKRSLIQLFNDSDEKVRALTASCFRRFEGEELGNYINLVEAFIDSEAFKDKAYDLIHGLEKTTAKLSELVTLSVFERFIKNLGTYSDGTEIASKLLIRMYSEAEDKDLKLLCLDIIDDMTLYEKYGIYEALQQFER
ncbi:MAG: hypothetical protein AAGF26_03660 [Cyanobacteria bacterium P01_G01_bin.49]